MFNWKLKRLRKDVEHLERKCLKQDHTIDKLCRDVHKLQKTVYGETHDRIEGALLFYAGERGLEEKIQDIAKRQRALEEYLRVSLKEEPAMPATMKMEPWPEPEENEDA